MKKYNETILNEIENIKNVLDEGITIINEGTREYKHIYEDIDCNYYNIDNCYSRSSRAKQNIWNRYVNKYTRMYNEGFTLIEIGVNSYNTCQFTICMMLRKDNIIYKLYISKVYNKIIAWEVK